MGKKTKVAIVKVKDGKIRIAIEKALCLINFKYSKLNRKVILKPNLVSASKPEYGKTTDPRIIDAITRLIQNEGKDVCIGESIASFSSEKVLRETGIENLCKQRRIKFIQFERLKQKLIVGIPPVDNIAIPSDLTNRSIINIPKLKLHLHPKIGMSCCIKNMFGCIPGVQKSLIHTKTHDGNEFFKTLVYMYNRIKPAVNIVDAINIYDKEPKHGKRIKLNLILAGEDGVAVDTVASKIIGFDKNKITLLRMAEKYNLGTTDTKNIEMLGERMKYVKIKLHHAGYEKRLYYSIMANLKNRYVSHFIKPRVSNKCGFDWKCIKECPTGSIKKSGEVDYATCLRCEHCLYSCKNITMENPILYKLRKMMGPLIDL